jgi:hypothetical protein
MERNLPKRHELIALLRRVKNNIEYDGTIPALLMQDIKYAIDRWDEEREEIKHGGEISEVAGSNS